jgi:hypothetical protein
LKKQKQKRKGKKIQERGRMGNLEEKEGNGLKGKERVLTPHMEWMNTWHNMSSIAREPENPGLGKTGGPGLFSASGAAHVWSVAKLSDYLFIHASVMMNLIS